MLWSCHQGTNQQQLPSLSVEELKSSNTTLEKELEQLMKTVLDSAVQHPEKYAAAFNHSNEFHAKTQQLHHHFQQAMQKVNFVPDTLDVDKKYVFTSAAPDYDMQQLVQAQNNFLKTAEDQLFFFPKAEKLAKTYFNTHAVKNKEGVEISWLDHYFKDSDISYQEHKLLELKNNTLQVELTFLKGLLENPQF